MKPEKKEKQLKLENKELNILSPQEKECEDIHNFIIFKQQKEFL
tara:strand:+ start:924 stop:1055 length:132 start_codon:yes stop_codon:yes gene_type:complete